MVVTLKDSFDCTLPTDRKETQIFYRSQQKNENIETAD